MEKTIAQIMAKIDDFGVDLTNSAWIEFLREIQAIGLSGYTTCNRH
ncbi:MAG: hypothetical protein JRJ62_15950 [Deltaproteobacteria bacterium]|nr:hypothetical protein [Deltaproteobacteria bacterium]